MTNPHRYQPVGEPGRELTAVIRLHHEEAERGCLLRTPRESGAAMRADLFHYLRIRPPRVQIDDGVYVDPRTVRSDDVDGMVSSSSSAPQNAASGRGVKSCGRFHGLRFLRR